MATMNDKVAADIMREIQQRRGGQRISDMIGSGRHRWGEDDPFYASWGRVGNAPEPSQSGSGWHPYFCLHCHTIEVYEDIPWQRGEPMRPWHEHAGSHYALQPLTHEAAMNMQKFWGIKATRNTKAVTIPPDKLCEQGSFNGNLVGLGSESEERLQAVLEKVAREGW